MTNEQTPLLPDTLEWHEERRKGIGGSDAAAVAGLSPWKTPLEVYLDKIGEGMNDETPDMRRGTLLEPAIRQMYADETGRQVVVPTRPFVHPTLPFVRVNLDGLPATRLGLECKSSRTRVGWGEPGTPNIPIVYLCQVQHGMAAAQLDRMDVAVLFGDFEFAIYPIEADPEFQELLLEQEAQFWRCVEARIPPDPVTADDLIRRWPRSVVDAVVASASDVQAARVLAVVKDRMKTLEGIEEAAKAILKASIRDAEGLHVGGELLCTWKSSKTNPRFDARRFQAEHPDLFSQYLVEAAPQRRFLLKGKCPCLQTMNTDLILPAIPANLLSPPEPSEEPA